VILTLTVEDQALDVLTMSVGTLSEVMESCAIQIVTFSLVSAG